jgi:hypothetical protein
MLEEAGRRNAWPVAHCGLRVRMRTVHFYMQGMRNSYSSRDVDSYKNFAFHKATIKLFATDSNRDNASSKRASARPRRRCGGFSRT